VPRSVKPSTRARCGQRDLPEVLIRLSVPADMQLEGKPVAEHVLCAISPQSAHNTENSVNQAKVKLRSRFPVSLAALARACRESQSSTRLSRRDRGAIVAIVDDPPRESRQQSLVAMSRRPVHELSFAQEETTETTVRDLTIATIGAPSGRGKGKEKKNRGAN